MVINNVTALAIGTSLGTQVSLIVRGEGVLRQFDAMLGASWVEIARDLGMQIVHNAVIESVSRLDDGALRLALQDGRQLEPVEQLIWAIGRLGAPE